MGRRKYALVPLHVEKANREEEKPPGLSAWDQYWYQEVERLAAVQKHILTNIIHERCWRSSDGRVRRLRDIDTRHLFNIVNMLERLGNQPDMLKAALEELGSRERDYFDE